MTTHLFPLVSKRTSILVSAMTALITTPVSLAARVVDGNIDSVLNLSLEELMQATVTSASKKAQSLAETASAVFVINADDIRRSGATNIPEALRLAPGVQVAAIGQNKWSVSIRGFNYRFSNKLLVLVDGRAIYSPAFSGVFWEHHDIPLRNIERIEVIRGPGGSIWGANAVNGVINIITYSAKDTQGGLVSAAAGNEVRGSLLTRYGWTQDNETQVRVHASGTLIDPGKAVAGGDGPDDWKTKQAGLHLVNTRGEDTFSFQGTVSDYKAGDAITAFMAAFPYATKLSTDGDGNTAHLLGRWERHAEGRTHSLQAYLDHGDSDIGIFRYRNDTLDIEYQQQVSGEKHDIVWGLGYRTSHDKTFGTPHAFMSEPSKTFNLYSAFIQDDVTLDPGLWRLTLGSRFEHNDFSGFEVQPNVRLLWTPTEADSVWAAVSRAVRTPSRGETSSTAVISPPTMLFPIPLASVGNSDMDSEKLNALDLGWRRQWSPNLTSDLAAFYYRYTDLRAVSPVAGPLFQGTDPYQPMLLTNGLGAESYGMELALDWLPRANWRLQLNTAVFNIDTRDATVVDNGQEFIGATPDLQVSVRSSLDISPDLKWDVWWRHVGNLKGGPTHIDDVAAYNNLDMRLAWIPARDLELSLVGQNLLKSSHPEMVTTNILSVPIEIERGVYVKADWKF